MDNLVEEKHPEHEPPDLTGDQLMQLTMAGGAFADLADEPDLYEAEVHR